MGSWRPRRSELLLLAVGFVLLALAGFFSGVFTSFFELPLQLIGGNLTGRICMQHPSSMTDEVFIAAFCSPPLLVAAWRGLVPNRYGSFPFGTAYALFFQLLGLLLSLDSFDPFL